MYIIHKYIYSMLVFTMYNNVIKCNICVYVIYNTYIYIYIYIYAYIHEIDEINFNIFIILPNRLKTYRPVFFLFHKIKYVLPKNRARLSFAHLS